MLAVVLEGADKVGKTTLAKAMAKIYGLEYYHFGPPGPDPMMEYVEFLRGLKKPAICDRFFVGNLIYGPLLRDKTTPWRDVVTMCRLLRRHGTYMMLVDAGMKHIATRFRKSAHELVTWQQNVQARHMFDKVWVTLPLNRDHHIIHWNETHDDMLDIVNEYREVFEKQQDLWKGFQDFSGIGTVDRAAFVLVGDSVNPNTTRFGLPFDSGPAAEFLGMCLHEAKVREEDVYITNQDVLTKEEVEHFQMKRSYFVALGKNAEKRLNKLGLKGYVNLEHPQYVRRFKSSAWAAYRDQLACAYVAYKGARSHVHSSK